VRVGLPATVDPALPCDSSRADKKLTKGCCFITNIQYYISVQPVSLSLFSISDEYVLRCLHNNGKAFVDTADKSFRTSMKNLNQKMNSMHGTLNE
jgi:hypothetical protein